MEPFLPPNPFIWLPGLDLAAAIQQTAALLAVLGLVHNARGLGIRLRSADYATRIHLTVQCISTAPASYFELASAPPDLTADALAAALQTQG